MDSIASARPHCGRFFPALRRIELARQDRVQGLNSSRRFRSSLALDRSEFLTPSRSRTLIEAPPPCIAATTSLFWHLRNLLGVSSDPGAHACALGSFRLSDSFVTHSSIDPQV